MQLLLRLFFCVRYIFWNFGYPKNVAGTGKFINDPPSPTLINHWTGKMLIGFCQIRECCVTPGAASEQGVSDFETPFSLHFFL